MIRHFFALVTVCASVLVPLSSLAQAGPPFPKVCADPSVMKAALQMSTTQETYDEDRGLGDFAGGPTSLAKVVSFYAPNVWVVAYGSRDATQVEVGSKITLDPKVDSLLVCGFYKAPSSTTLTAIVLAPQKKAAKSGPSPMMYKAPYDARGGKTILLVIGKSRQAVNLYAKFTKTP